jgi:hypothetical protein
MIVSIMQPYFLPYIGYFQLFHNSDVFVLHDDVQYIKDGWVNRNRILVNGAPAWITLPVLQGSYRLKINQREYQLERPIVHRILRRIDAAYRDAPYFDHIMPLLRDILGFADPNVAAFNANLVRRIACHLELTARVIRSSALAKEDHLSGEERVIDMCRLLGATRYVNPIGGVKLYSTENFARYGISLSFLDSRVAAYAQFGEEHVPSLSIVDVLMFNGRDAIRKLLTEFSLTSPP